MYLMNKLEAEVFKGLDYITPNILCALLGSVK